MHDVQTKCWQQRKIVDAEPIDLTWRTLSTYQILSLYLIFTMTSLQIDVQSNDLKTSKKAWRGHTLEMHDVYEMRGRKAVVEMSTIWRVVSYQTVCWISSRLLVYRTEYLCCLKTEEESLFQNLKFTLTSLTAIKCVLKTSEKFVMITIICRTLFISNVHEAQWQDSAKKDCCDDYLNLKNSFYQIQIQNVLSFFAAPSEVDRPIVQNRVHLLRKNRSKILWIWYLVSLAIWNYAMLYLFTVYLTFYQQRWHW